LQIKDIAQNVECLSDDLTFSWCFFLQVKGAGSGVERKKKKLKEGDENDEQEIKER